MNQWAWVSANVSLVKRWSRGEGAGAPTGHAVMFSEYINEETVGEKRQEPTGRNARLVTIQATTVYSKYDNSGLTFYKCIDMFGLHL